MLLASEANPAFGLLDSRWIVGNRSEPGTSRNAACGYAARRISSNLKGSTKQFGWLQASATKISFLSPTSANPATIRICIPIGGSRKLHLKESSYISRWARHDSFAVCLESVQVRSQTRRSLHTSRLRGTNLRASLTISALKLSPVRNGSPVP